MDRRMGCVYRTRIPVHTIQKRLLGKIDDILLDLFLILMSSEPGCRQLVRRYKRIYWAFDFSFAGELGRSGCFEISFSSSQAVFSPIRTTS